MDLDIFETTNDAVFIQFRHPKTRAPLFVQMDGDEGPVDNPELPIGVKVFGMDSPENKRHRRKFQDQMKEQGMKRKGGALLDIPSEVVERASEETLAACIHSFVNVVVKGKTLKAPEDSLPFIRKMTEFAEQIDTAIGTRSVFMTALPKS